MRALVLHEPPLPELLPDRDRWRAAFQDVHDTYRDHGVGAAMGKFIATVDGPDAPPPAMPPEALEMMGRIQGNLDYFLRHVLLPALRFEPDVTALRAGFVRPEEVVHEHPQRVTAVTAPPERTLTDGHPQRGHPAVRIEVPVVVPDHYATEDDAPHPPG